MDTCKFYGRSLSAAIVTIRTERYSGDICMYHVVHCCVTTSVCSNMLGYRHLKIWNPLCFNIGTKIQDVLEMFIMRLNRL